MILLTCSSWVTIKYPTGAQRRRSLWTTSAHCCLAGATSVFLSARALVMQSAVVMATALPPAAPAPMRRWVLPSLPSAPLAPPAGFTVKQVCACLSSFLLATLIPNLTNTYLLSHLTRTILFLCIGQKLRNPKMCAVLIYHRSFLWNRSFSCWAIVSVVQ